jgi:hypothetical protein
VWDGVRNRDLSFLLAHETKFQSRALDTWAYRRGMSSTSFARLCDEGLALHHFTPLAEGQTKNEAWRLDEKQHRPMARSSKSTPFVLSSVDQHFLHNLPQLTRHEDTFNELRTRPNN